MTISNYKNHICTKIVAIVVVCIFSFNTVSWAVPDFLKSLQPKNDSTLQARLMFNDISEADRFILETGIIAATIEKMKDGEVAIQDIISRFLKLYEGKSDQEPLLEVTSKQPVAEDGDFYVTAVVRKGKQKGKVFRIYASGRFVPVSGENVVENHTGREESKTTPLLQEENIPEPGESKSREWDVSLPEESKLIEFIGKENPIDDVIQSVNMALDKQDWGSNIERGHIQVGQDMAKGIRLMSIGEYWCYTSTDMTVYREIKTSGGNKLWIFFGEEFLSKMKDEQISVLDRIFNDGGYSAKRVATGSMGLKSVSAGFSRYFKFFICTAY